MTDGILLLLVDDEQDFTSALGRRLSKRGIVVEVANSGEAGLDKLAQSAADVVLLDVRMPGMDGLSVLHKIKEQWPLTEVIMLTGHASMEVAIRGMELGAFDYLMKPVEFQELLYKVEDAASRKRLQEGKMTGRKHGAQPGTAASGSLAGQGSTMSFSRRLFALLTEAARMHARWEIEVSANIIRDRRKVWLLVALTAVGLLGTYAFAAGADLELPAMLGGTEAYSPAFYTTSIFVASMGIGLCAGLITGCIGAGGGFIITPAIMSLGIKGILAVGTDLFHIFAKAIMGTAMHKKLGNVSAPLAVAFLIGSGVGVLGGGVLNRLIYEANPVASDAFISVIYVVLLGFLGTYALVDFLRLRKVGNGVDAYGGSGEVSEGLPAKLQQANIPPMITFDRDLIPGGKRISGWFVAACGGVVGFMAAIMGVGGGFLTFPMFVYVLGVSSFTTVGTDILQIIFTAGFAAITQYAIYGFIFYTLAMGMLLGSLFGIQVGALVTKLVPGIYIRGFYALAILSGFVNRLFAMPGKLGDMKLIAISPGLAEVLAQVGNGLFFVVIGIFAVWVIGTFLFGLKLLREG